jgi:hypothetical protein
MPLIKVYNIDSDLYGLKGHSIFKSVCNTRSFVKRNLRPSYRNSFSRKPLLPRRPSATKHRPNTTYTSCPRTPLLGLACISRLFEAKEKVPTSKGSTGYTSVIIRRRQELMACTITSDATTSHTRRTQRPP